MSRESAPQAFQARFVFPVDRPPIEHGVVTVQAGRIVAVGENAAGHRPTDLGNVALLPGLVNAHTHLEFSGLESPLGQAGEPFPQWIAHVVALRRQAAKDGDAAGERAGAIARGLQESRNCGVVALGEIATPPWSADEFAKNFPGTVFLELLGLAPERVEPLMELARQHVRPNVSLTLRQHGLSPHAPYTVHPDLLRQSCALSADTQTPVAMHLAESIEELELLRSHSGGMVELLQSLDAWHGGSLPRGLRPLDYLHALAAAHRALVIHGNFLLADEVEFVAARRDRMTVVYCPRTHAYFRHGTYSLAEMLAAGVRVALGTDSRASNPDLSVFAEMRHVAQHHTVPLEEVLRMGTLYGAQALGIATEFGTIARGKNARLCTVAFSEDQGDPHELLLRAATGEVRPV